MICPRCSVAEISPETNRCQLCGYALLGSALVGVQAPVADEVLETVQRELRDRFELQALVRRDRGSSLYLARDVEDDRLVSLRLIPRQGPVDGPLLNRFAQAATLAGEFRHPHVVALRKHGVTVSLLWYATDVVKSQTLGNLLESGEPMPLDRSLELLEQIASGLEYLHRNGVVHAGIGRETVLVDAEGWVRITDPGTAAAIYRAVGPGHGWESLLDLPFAAPELLDRRLMGPGADQYSLAVVAYTCLTGRTPFEGDSVEDIRRERVGVVPPLRELRPDLPPHAEVAIQKGLRDEPTERFGSVLDFVAVLSGALARSTGAMLTPAARQGATPTVVGPPPSGGWAPSRKLLVGALMVVGIVLGGWMLSLLVSGDDGDGGWVAGPAAPATATPAADPGTGAASPTDVGADGSRDVGATVPADEGPRVPTGPSGTLFINATPWGSLYVDDVLVGNTPQVNLRLPAGTHRLRIVRDGFAPWEQEIRLAAGGTVRLTDIVLEPIQP